MTEFADLSIQLVQHDIIVTMPETGYSVTYRKDGRSAWLFAIDGIDRTDIPAKVQFWAKAWKAAHKKARAVGWLNSWPRVARSRVRDGAISARVPFFILSLLIWPSSTCAWLSMASTSSLRNLARTKKRCGTTRCKGKTCNSQDNDDPNSRLGVPS